MPTLKHEFIDNLYCQNGNFMNFSHTNRMCFPTTNALKKSHFNQCASNPLKLFLAQWGSRPPSNTLSFDLSRLTTPNRETISIFIYTAHPWTNPTNHPKRHPDPVSRFSTIHRTDRSNDRQTQKPYTENHQLQ